MRRLIINADDFGLTSGINRAILEGHRRGVITSSTLMSNGGAHAEAVQMAQSAPQLGVGCHVVLIDGAPILPAAQVSGLLQNRPQFPAGFAGFALRCLRGRVSQEEVEAEATAQIRKLQSGGITVSHIDTHKHTHMFPQVLAPLLHAARKCGIKAIRNPLEPIRLAQVAGEPGLWKRWGQVKILQKLTGNFRRAIQDAGMVTPDGTLGIVATGVLGQRIFRMIVDHIPDGTWELVCHPGYNDAALQQISTRLRKSRELELEVLTAPDTRDRLARNGVELISYKDLY